MTRTIEFPFPEDELETGQALVQVKRGPNAGSTFLLDTDSSSVGRNTDSVVFLDDITVSRRHATFERRPGGEWFVRDAGSLNGTYVNGEQVDETKLAHGRSGADRAIQADVLPGRGVRCRWPARATTSRSGRSSCP